MSQNILPALPIGLNGPAAAELEKRVQQFRADLLAEAGRLEAAGGGAAAGEPEITSSMIRDADLLIRRAYRRPRQSRWLIAAKIVAVVGGFITGMLADFDKLKDPGLLLVFIAALAITIVAAVISVLKE